MTETPGDTESPGDLITRYETVLRELIRTVLGEGWHEGSGIDLDKLREKQTYERGRRKGVVVPDDLLAFTEHLELVKIINKKWEKFARILGDKKRWTVYSDRIAAIRNAPMHGRQLLHFERQLLAGMTGEVSNIVAQFRSSQGPDANWYPVIESVTDSLGNDLKDQLFGEIARVAVGDTVRFRCVGRDPQERTLSWVMQKVPWGRTVDEAVGAEVELKWVVGPEDVSESTYFHITLKSSGKYHRNGADDETLSFSYAVNPPE